MRRAPLAIAIALIALAVIAVIVVLRPPADLATPSPSPSPTAAPTATATATATATPAASPSPSPSPTPQGLYVSKRLGYALTLTPPWRRASCPALDQTRTALPIVEHFTNVSAMDEEIGHIGTPNDRIEVFAFANPQRLSAVDFAKSNPLPGPVPAGSSPQPESVTFAGRPAAQLSFPDWFVYFLFVPDSDRMFTIAARAGASSRSPDLQAILPVVRTFRFVGAAETAALPEPTPFPVGGPTPQALAATLAAAFRQKDVATLERLLSPCVSQGVQNGGGSAITRERFIASLRTQFAAGLTVTVDTSTARTEPRYGPGMAAVRSRWNAQPPMSVGAAPSPGQTTQNVDLWLAPTPGGFYWHGTILLPPG
jgi:hypothetical protein